MRMFTDQSHIQHWASCKEVRSLAFALEQREGEKKQAISTRLQESLMSLQALCFVLKDPLCQSDCKQQED